VGDRRAERAHRGARDSCGRACTRCRAWSSRRASRRGRASCCSARPRRRWPSR
jgi:hypothetical protein